MGWVGGCAQVSTDGVS